MSEAAQTETGNEYPHRYNALMAQKLEGKWQDYLEREETFHAPNPGEEGLIPPGRRNSSWICSPTPPA